ncbi:hypothetical protein AB0D62_28540 [Streptomyces massasporeus]|uniref:hypothetical protein n=1 Tax=Streptomyces massasporeus TaxID=67324 RepID=UPI0033D86218
MGLSQHWNHDGAASDRRRTWQRRVVGRTETWISPAELRDLNHLAHAARAVGARDIAGILLGMLGPRATRTPWSYTGDAEQQITKWRKELRPGA